MGMVAPEQRIASAFVVFCGRYGDVQRQALERGVCRQRLYREAAWVRIRVEETRWQQENARLREQVRDLEERNRQLQQRLTQVVVVDQDKQAEFACVGQAMGVSLPELQTFIGGSGIGRSAQRGDVGALDPRSRQEIRGLAGSPG